MTSEANSTVSEAPGEQVAGHHLPSKSQLEQVAGHSEDVSERPVVTKV